MENTKMTKMQKMKMKIARKISLIVFSYVFIIKRKFLIFLL